MRLEKRANLLWRGQPAVNQFKEDGLDDFAVGCQFRCDAHLLHKRMRDALACFRPDLQEKIEALFDG